MFRKQTVKRDPKTREKITIKSKSWYFWHTNADGISKPVKGFPDRKATEQKKAKLEKEAALALVGVRDPFATHRKRTLEEHARDFESFLKAKGRTRSHVADTKAQIDRAIKGCRFVFIADVSLARFQEFLGELKAKGKSARTVNAHAQAMTAFLRWLVKDGRTDRNPLQGVSRMNVDADRKRVHRALTEEELACLIAGTLRGPNLMGLSGTDRATAYLLGSVVGLRRREIASLTVRSFDFGSRPTTVTVEARSAKNRRQDALPLREDLAAYLKAWIASKATVSLQEPLLPIGNKRTSTMIRKDLARVGLKIEDERGHVAVFHSTRHTAITRMARAGLHPKVAQTLARHSDINLTMGAYTHLQRIDLARDLENLPPLPGLGGGKRKALSATGTEGGSLHASLQEQGSPGCTPIPSRALTSRPGGT